MTIPSWVSTLAGQVLGLLGGYIVDGGELTWKAVGLYLLLSVGGLLKKQFTIGKKETV